MKRKTSKILGLILAVLMLIGLLPISALAVEGYNVWVGGIQVTSANAANILGDGTASYNAATKTLTLNGFSYEGEAEGIHAETDLITNLIGDNTITMKSKSEDVVKAAVNTWGGDLIIIGDGTLTVIGLLATDNNSAYSHGIDARMDLEGNGGSITIKDTTVTARSGSGGQSYGLYARNNIRIENSTVTVSSDKAKFDSYAICNEEKDIDIIDSTVKISAMQAETGISCGLFCVGGNLNIKNSDVDIMIEPSNMESSIMSCGIQSPNGLTITDGSKVNVTVQGGENMQRAIGVYLFSGDMLIEKESDVTITCGNAQSASYGILGANKVTVNSGTLTVATGECGNDENYYLIQTALSGNELELINAKVTVDAGKSNSVGGRGVNTDKLSVDEKSVLKVTQAGGGANENVGVFCGYENHISGEVYAVAGEPGVNPDTGERGKSFGIMGVDTKWNVDGLLEARGHTMAAANKSYELLKITVTADEITAGASYDGSDAQPVAKTGDKATLEVIENYKYILAQRSTVTEDIAPEDTAQEEASLAPPDSDDMSAPSKQILNKNIIIYGICLALLIMVLILVIIRRRKNEG